MVRVFDRIHSIQKSKSFNLKKMFESPGRPIKSLAVDDEKDEETPNYQPTSQANGRPIEFKYLGSPLDRHKSPVSFASTKPPSPKDKQSSDMEQMKERFSKLLLGEDMSGGGKGVSSALALSNAITNLAASVFGEQSKLEPMSPDRKARWRKEIDWLLSVTDHIVEFVPSQQKSKDGVSMEIMVTLQRSDLLVNIPALRKLDAMLIDLLDQFENQKEFWYVSPNDEDSENGSTPSRNDDKWWIPTPKVPANGLSDVARRWLQFQKDSVNQVLKAAMAINAQVLSEMEIPENYIESLPKNGRSSLGDLIYKSITVEYFDPEQLLSTMDLSTEHKVLDLKNRIEASIVIWKRKMNQKDTKSSWGSAISLEKRELFEERAETILLILKHRFPGIPQSVLDISKIEYNEDVGQSILESYSRIIESLAFKVISRIDDVLYADSITQAQSASNESDGSVEDTENSNSAAETPTSKTLSDFMGWNLDQGDLKKMNGEQDQILYKPNKISVTPKKLSYLEKLENLSGIRSPTARH